MTLGQVKNIIEVAPLSVSSSSTIHLYHIITVINISLTSKI